MPITVLLADDAEVVRRAIGRLLKQEPTIKLVGEAADFEQTIKMANELRPDVIVMDLHMPGLKMDASGSLLPRLKDADSRIVAISVANNEEAKALAAKIGASILVDKMKLFDELIPAITRFASANEPGT